MRISLIHPSRGRPQKAKETYGYWMGMSSGENEIEHILSLDFSDPSRQDYPFFGPNSKIIEEHNNSVVEATNEACKSAKGDILIYLSDDFKCPHHWDKEVVNFINLNAKQPEWLLKVDDCLQKFEARVLTIPFMSRALYERLGYFWHPDFKSMWVDCHLYEICHKNNWLLFAPHLKFAHEHYSNGKAQRDDTYIRSDLNWNEGKMLFEKHLAEGFKL